MHVLYHEKFNLVSHKPFSYTVLILQKEHNFYPCVPVPLEDEHESFEVVFSLGSIVGKLSFAAEVSFVGVVSGAVVLLLSVGLVPSVAISPPKTVAKHCAENMSLPHKAPLYVAITQAKSCTCVYIS